MKRLNVAALLSVLVVGVFSVGCGGEVEEAGPEMEAPTVMLRPLIDNVDTESRLVAAVRGPGQIGYLVPRSARRSGEIVTTFQVQNTSPLALAGFTVQEFWYDEAGDTLTGGEFRMRRPLLQEEVVEITLRVPRNSRAVRSNYEFSHQNGVIEAVEFEEMPEPTAIVDEEVEVRRIDTDENINFLFQKTPFERFPNIEQFTQTAQYGKYAHHTEAINGEQAVTTGIHHGGATYADEAGIRPTGFKRPNQPCPQLITRHLARDNTDGDICVCLLGHRGT